MSYINFTPCILICCLVFVLISKKLHFPDLCHFYQFISVSLPPKTNLCTSFRSLSLPFTVTIELCLASRNKTCQNMSRRLESQPAPRCRRRLEVRHRASTFKRTLKDITVKAGVSPEEHQLFMFLTKKKKTKVTERLCFQ